MSITPKLRNTNLVLKSKADVASVEKCLCDHIMETQAKGELQ